MVDSTDPWRAQWIVPRAENQHANFSLPSPIEPRANLWFCSRAHWKRTDAAAPATVRIATDSKYWLWINGRLAVFEGQLKRGPNPRDTYYDTVDVTPFLEAGDNVVSILVWYFGRDGFGHHSSGKPGLIVESADGMLMTGEHWKTRRHPAFGDTGLPRPNVRLPESNVHFDARLDLPGWETNQYDDRDWPSAVACGRPPCSPWGRLVPRPTPLWRDTGLMDFIQHDIESSTDGKTVHTARLPRNLAITPWLELTAPAGALIELQTDNYLGGSAPNLRAEYVTREGLQHWELPAYLNGHEVQVRVPAEVKLSALKYRETGYATDFVGCFSSDDPFLNRLWQKSLHTMDINMRDAIQDPDREGAQWWGDEVIILNQIFHSCDSRAHAVIRKGILELAAWQREDDVLYSPIPGCWRIELPQQSLASIGQYGFWQYYWHTGDAKLLEDVFPAMARYLALWSWDAEDLVIYRKGDWDWADWGQNIDSHALLQCWMALALEGAANAAAVVGETTLSAQWTNRRERLALAFRKHFWRGDGFASPNHKGPFDDRVQGMALAAGLALPVHHEAIFHLLENEHNSGPYLEYFILDGLFRVNRAEQALARMKRRYTEMVSSPLSTLWEGWAVGSSEFGGGTYNHGWAGGPLTLLSRYLAGFQVLTPGTNQIRISPQLCGLSELHAIFPTFNGPLDLYVATTDSQISVTLDVPSGLQVELAPPERHALPGDARDDIIYHAKTGMNRLVYDG